MSCNKIEYGTIFSGCQLEDDRVYRGVYEKYMVILQKILLKRTYLVSELSPSSVEEMPPTPTILEVNELLPIESLSSLSTLTGGLTILNCAVDVRGTSGGGGGCGGSFFPFVVFANGVVEEIDESPTSSSPNNCLAPFSFTLSC